MWSERTTRTPLPRLPYHQRIVICDESGELHALFSHTYLGIEFIDTRHLAQAIQAVQNCPAHALLINAVPPDELYTQIEQARQVIPDTPIIGYILPVHVDQALAASVQRYLIKPVTRADLRQMLLQAASTEIHARPSLRPASPGSPASR